MGIFAPALTQDAYASQAALPLPEWNGYFVARPKHFSFCPFVVLLCGAGELTAGYVCQPGTPGSRCNRVHRATLLRGNTSLTGSNTMTSVIHSAPARMFVTVSPTIGPATTQIGDIGQCQGVNALTGVPFGCDPNAGSQLSVLPGTANTNINSHTLYSLGVTNTTTNTFLISQSYELDGARGPAPASQSRGPSRQWLWQWRDSGVYEYVHYNEESTKLNV